VPLTTEKAELLGRVAAALRFSGWQVLWLTSDHPARVRLINGSAAPIEAWIHIWNVTPGGRPKSRPLERRIQPTGIGDHFFRATGVETLILGWSDETKVFAAFDFQYHSGQMGSSPSIQTDLPTLEAAAQNGIGVFAKSTGELSIAIRPDMLGLYLEQRQVLHTLGKDAVQLDALRQMALDPLEVEPDDLPANRRKVMTTTLRLLRERRFGEKVLAAYDHRCALCGVQLRLLDAAHILPVAHPDSHDHVTNGVALCALHHRAYDTALLAFDQSYAIIVNNNMLVELTNEGRDGGLGEFQAALAPSLLLPRARASHPSLDMIVKANTLRGWRLAVT
jgi:putative restriction endonuclease